MTYSEQKNLTENYQTVENSSDSSSAKMLTLKVIEYLFLAAFVGSFAVTKIVPDLQVSKIYIAAFLPLWLLFFFINGQLSNYYKSVAGKSDLAKKAELYTHLLGSNNHLGNNSMTLVRENALHYCQELIDDYKRTRRNARNIYYISQITTIVFSGVTPILVLVDKLEPNSSWLRWLPVICPAVAAIVASIVTSFPFQETWMAANTTVELLEAEQEKFVLGVTEPYRCFDLNDTQRQQKAQQAIENFITQVNNIHFKQVQETSQAKGKSEAKPQEEKAEFNQQASQPQSPELSPIA